MSFNWSDYLHLGQDLVTQAASSPYQEANLRTAISRAYYASFHKARIRLYDKWAISVPSDATAHTAVRREFRKKREQRIAVNLDRMRIDRNRADYDDIVVDLIKTANENLKRANRVISDLSRL
jgi:uncharacterized protein (UPF0332 family)